MIRITKQNAYLVKIGTVIADRLNRQVTIVGIDDYYTVAQGNTKLYRIKSDPAQGIKKYCRVLV
jgi:hypothetical protein